MVDEADISASKGYVRLNGKFTFRIKSWRSSRLKTINSQQNVRDDHEYSFHNTPGLPAPSSVSLYTVPEVAVNLDMEDDDPGEIKWHDGRRVIELKHLADQMHCIQC